MIGLSNTFMLQYSGDRIDPETALRIGLISKICPDDKLMEETLTFAKRLAAGPSYDYVEDLGASDEEEHAVELGAALLHRYATGDAASIAILPVDVMTLEEKDVHCYLCALGRHMARIITAYDGPQAITELVRQGPAEFILRAAEIESVRGRDLLTEETVSAIREIARQG